MSIEERARHIKERNGCIICLDRTGQRQSATCVHKGKWKTSETVVDGRPCSKDQHGVSMEVRWHFVM